MKIADIQADDVGDIDNGTGKNCGNSIRESIVISLPETNSDGGVALDISRQLRAEFGVKMCVVIGLIPELEGRVLGICCPKEISDKVKEFARKVLGM